MRKKVLVVERDEAILDIVTRILEDQGYQVSQSRSENGMVQRIISEKPDVILLDIIKLTPEGTELCDVIKRTEGIKHIPVIVLSTHPSLAHSKIDCADDIISKPFDIAEILKTVENQLSV